MLRSRLSHYHSPPGDLGPGLQAVPQLWDPLTVSDIVHLLLPPFPHLALGLDQRYLVQETMLCLVVSNVIQMCELDNIGVCNRDIQRKLM